MKSFLFSICLLVSAAVASAQTNAPASPAGPVPDLARLQAEIKGTRLLTWVITGDSITHGAKWLGRERSYPEIINERIRWEMGRYRDMLINSGVTGEKAPGLLADFDWRVLRFKPDVVSVMIGMNDSAAGPAGREKFAQALREMVHRIRAAGAIPILNRTNPIDTGRDPGRSDLPAYNDIIAQVATDENVILVDHWTYWHQACPDLASRRGWLANSIHPNAAGHRQMAILFFKTLGIYVRKPQAASRKFPAANSPMIRFILLAVLVGAVDLAPAVITLPPVFTDNMVLQRGMPVPVWGRAEAGETIRVEFAGQEKTTTADAAGKWRVDLASLPASNQSRILRIQGRAAAGQESRQFTNVVVGEVWLAAGQSNMEFPLSREESARTAIPAATNSWLRLLNFSFAGQYYYAKPFTPADVARQTPEDFYTGSWQACSPGTARAFSAVAYYFGLELAQKLSVPVGIIHCAVGGSPTEAWIPSLALATDPSLAAMVNGNWLTNAALDDWCRLRGHQNLDASLQAGLAVPGDNLGPNHAFKPGFLWAAGPARFAPFALRGVLWYQGESNSLEERRVRQHALLFPLLVREWRAAWGTDFPFLFCQLSSIATNNYKSACWPEFRDQQRRFLSTIPGTGMAVTSDIGLPNDVHPRNKSAVGHRLALWALAGVYGEDLLRSGPLPETIRADGATLVVRFDYATGLKTADGQAPRGFEIAGADGVFHPATVEFAGATARLSSPEVARPVVARYAWSPYTDANLVNVDGLPASTFKLAVDPPPAHE